jgi:hypothetical protein
MTIPMLRTKPVEDILAQGGDEDGPGSAHLRKRLGPWTSSGSASAS